MTRFASASFFGLSCLICFDLIFSHFDSPKGNTAYLGGGILSLIIGLAIGKYMGGGWEDE